MKKSILSLAVAAGVSTSAMAAMHINHQGVGEALVYPLYTAQNGNDTYIAVVNTTNKTKAVKVRILEAENSVEVLDFNLYMSPQDHFSFAITANEDGGASLVTNDKSCTVPQISGAIPFRGFKYANDKSAADAEGDDVFDNTSISRTQIGHIEVIEMGQIDEDDGWLGEAVYEATLHDADGVPGNCAAHTALWSVPSSAQAADPESIVGAWLEDFGYGFESQWMGGGLYGYGQVVNVAEGTAFGYDAVAIADMVATPQFGGILHYEPGNIEPNFNDAAITNMVDTEAGMVTTDAGLPVLAVAALFQTTQLENDYVIDADINALTDWVITQPTKNYHVSEDPAVEPYNAQWNGKNACEYIAMTSWDREEANPAPVVIPGQGPDFSPTPDVTPTDPTNPDVPLCYETNVLQFGTSSAINAKDVVVGVNAVLEGSEGWARVSMDDASLFGGTAGDTARTIEGLEGLPVTGFAVIKYTNSSANEAGALANYAVSTEHKTMVTLSTN